MTIFGITSALASVIFKFTSKYLIKGYAIGAALTMEALILLWCFLWRASGSSVWQVYVVAAFMGFADSVRETALSGEFVGCSILCKTTICYILGSVFYNDNGYQRMAEQRIVSLLRIRCHCVVYNPSALSKT